MVMCVVGMRWERGEKSVEKKRDRRFFYILEGSWACGGGRCACAYSKIPCAEWVRIGVWREGHVGRVMDGVW